MNNKDFNNIKIPENIDEVIENTFSKAYKVKNRKRTKKVTAIVAAGLVSFVLLGIMKPEAISAMPILQKVFE